MTRTFSFGASAALASIQAPPAKAAMIEQINERANEQIMARLTAGRRAQFRAAILPRAVSTGESEPRGPSVPRREPANQMVTFSANRCGELSLASCPGC